MSLFPLHLLRRLTAPAAALILAAGAVQAAPTSYTITPGKARFIYSMAHPLHAWKGVSTEAKGTIRTDDSLRTAAVDITIPVLSFDSDNRNRDSHMAEVVESYIYSDVRFHSTEVRLDTAAVAKPGAEPAAGFVWHVRGTISFHGVERPVSCPVQVEVAGGSLHAHGNFDLKLTDFDLELPSLLGVKVKNHIGVVFDVEAQAPELPVSKVEAGSVSG